MQARLLNLLRGLSREMGLKLVFVTHDFGLASDLCERIAVLYWGRIVENWPRPLIPKPKLPIPIAPGRISRFRRRRSALAGSHVIFQFAIFSNFDQTPIER